MSDTIDRDARFVTKLIEMSQKGVIAWEPDPSGGYVSSVFGRKIRAVQVPRDMPFAGQTHIPSSGRTREIPILEVYDDTGKVGFTFEGVAGLGNLVFLASYLGSGVNDLMNKVLAS